MSTTKPIPESSKTVGNQNTDDPLADMDAKADADLVIYDGKCKFCRAQVQRLAWFGGDRLTFVSLHDERVAQRFPELSHEQLMQQMYVVTPSGKHYAGAAAVRYLSRRLPKLWFLAPLMHIPFSLPLWQFVYGQIAKSRYSFGGSCEEGSCNIS